MWKRPWSVQGPNSGLQDPKFQPAIDPFYRRNKKWTLVHFYSRQHSQRAWPRMIKLLGRPFVPDFWAGPCLPSRPKCMDWPKWSFLITFGQKMDYFWSIFGQNPTFDRGSVMEILGKIFIFSMLLMNMKRCPNIQIYEVRKPPKTTRHRSFLTSILPLPIPKYLRPLPNLSRPTPKIAIFGYFWPIPGYPGIRKSRNSWKIRKKDPFWDRCQVFSAKSNF